MIQMETIGYRSILSSIRCLLIYLRKSCMKVLIPFGVNIPISIVRFLLLTKEENSTVLFNILSLYLRYLSWDVSYFTSFPFNPCFLRRNTCFLRRYNVISGVLRSVLHVVQGGGVPCVARRRLKPCMWCYPSVQFNLLVRSPIPGPSPAPIPTGDWGAELCVSSVSTVKI